MNEYSLEDIIDYKIPKNLRGELLPETDILIPKEAIGLYADCPIGLDENSKDSFAEVIFCGENDFRKHYSYEMPFTRFEEIANKYLMKN